MREASQDKKTSRDPKYDTPEPLYVRVLARFVWRRRSLLRADIIAKFGKMVTDES